MSWYSWSVGADVTVGASDGRAVVGQAVVGHSVGRGEIVGQGVLFGSYSVGQGVGTPGACRRRPVGSSRTPPPAAAAAAAAPLGADGEELGEEELGEEVGVPAALWHQHPTARIATAAPRHRGARIL